MTSPKTIVYSVISAKLDYCNFLFIDVPDYLIAKLQRALTASIVLNLKKYDSVTPHPIELHWLRIRQCIIYKVNLVVFKALNGDPPHWIKHQDQ